MTAPNTPDHAAEDHEALAGEPTDDGFPRDSDPTPGGEHPIDQQPEVTELGRRAVESGDPDGEDRPNGDPLTVGHPVGGGDRSPSVGDQEDREEQDQAAGREAPADDTRES